MESRESGERRTQPPTVRDYEAAFRRIAVELEKLGIATGLLSWGPERPALRELDALTRREWEIAERFLDGNDVGEIARRSYISEHTVRNHLKSIRGKLGASSQIDLLRKLGPLARRPVSPELD